MNSFLLEGDDFVATKNEMDKIIKQEKFLDAPINIYDLETTFLENALEDLDTFGLLSEKKVVVIKNIDSIKYDEYKNDFDHLFKYIDNPSTDNLLIIISKKLNNTLKIVKTLKSKCKYIKVEINTKKFIKDYFKDFKIDNNTINYLDEICLSDLTKIENECLKLKNYKIDEKEILKKDIDLLVVKKLGDAKDLTFSFVRSLSERDTKDALLRYQELLLYNLDPFSIVGLIESQIRIIYQVKILSKKNLSDKEIAKQLDEKSDYRIRKTRELTSYYTETELLNLMQDISELDLKMKSTSLDPKGLIEMFILEKLAF